MSRVALLAEQIRGAHRIFTMITSDVTQEQLSVAPGGTANSIGERYAHLVGTEDALVNHVFRGGAPLFDAAFKGKTGISEPRIGSDPEWSRRVRVDLAAAREYASAVFRSTEDHVAGLSDADLDRTIDLSSAGQGIVTAAWFLSELVTAHAHQVGGEIAAVKGLQGGRGLPF